MTTALFPLLLLLTLLDLAFVQATEVVAFADLVPLWAFAVAAPALRRLQRFWLYRTAWNGGVITVFAILVHHATTTGLLHMLEDGLVLAVLCQVHLLNNVSDRQRPDLVFFNTFLIAFVTSFFAAGVAWSLLFALHAFALVPSLQLHALQRSGSHIGTIATRALLRASVSHTLAIGALTAGAFVLWPRDFRREGWLGTALQNSSEAGLAERIRLDDDHPIRLGDDIVARFVPMSGQRDDLPTHWRSIAFSHFDGSAWSQQEPDELGPRQQSDATWEPRAHGIWQLARHSAAPTTQLRIHVEQRSGERLLLPLDTVKLRLQEARGLTLEPLPFAGLRALRPGDAPDKPLAFDIDLATTPSALPIGPRTRQHFTLLPDHGLPAAVHTLATQLREELPRLAPALERAEWACTWLQQHRRYQLPGEPGFARNLAEFLLGSGAGHCEYFATALALLLRAQAVPCRLVGGFYVHEREPTGHASIARSRDAHAWVEVLDESGAWHAFDATPAAAVLAATTGVEADQSAWLAPLKRWWAAVTTYDQSTRNAWLARLDPRGSAALALYAALILCAATAYVRRLRRGEPAVLALQRALRAARLRLLPGETPRELAARAAQAGLAPERLSRLRTALSTHERVRYGAPTSIAHPDIP